MEEINVFDLFASITLDDREYNEGLERASGKTSSFAASIGKGLQSAVKVGAAAVATITTAAVAMTNTFVKSASDVAEYGDNIDKMSQKMGLSAQAYQEWDFIMQHSGTSIESLQASMKTLANAVDSGNDAFERLGISQSEIAEMNQEELFAKTIEQLQKVEDTTERTYLAGQLLGRGATELGALLNTSAEDTAAMRQQVHELGGVMSNEAVKAAAAYQDSLQNMQTAFSGIQRGMLSEFLPSMVSVMDGLALIFSGNDSGIAKITEGVNQFADKLMEAVPKIFELGEGILSSLATAILDNLPTLMPAATNVIMQLFDGIVSALPQLAEAAIEIVQSLTQGLIANVDTIIPAIVELINVLSTGILEMLPVIIGLGLELIVSLANGIADALPQLIPTIIDIVLQIVDTLTDPATLANLTDAYIAIMLGLANGLIEALPVLLEKVPEIIANLVTAIVENIPKLTEASFTLIDALATGLIDNISQIIDAGKNIVEGLWDGIKSMASWITDKVTGFFSGIVDGVKGLLGIHSPSTVFADMGKNMALGLGEGWDKSFGQIKSDIEGGMNFESGYTVNTKTAGTSAGGVIFSGLSINISGANYSDENALAEAISYRLQQMVDRRAAVYA